MTRCGWMKKPAGRWHKRAWSRFHQECGVHGLSCPVWGCLHHLLLVEVLRPTSRTRPHLLSPGHGPHRPPGPTSARPLRSTTAPQTSQIDHVVRPPKTAALHRRLLRPSAGPATAVGKGDVDDDGEGAKKRRSARCRGSSRRRPWRRITARTASTSRGCSPRRPPPRHGRPSLAASPSTHRGKIATRPTRGGPVGGGRIPTLGGDILITSTRRLRLLQPRVDCVDSRASRRRCFVELRRAAFALRTLGLNNIDTGCTAQRNTTTPKITMMTPIASRTAKDGARRSAELCDVLVTTWSLRSSSVIITIILIINSRLINSKHISFSRGQRYGKYWGTIDSENQPWNLGRGYSRSFKMVPLESFGTVSYSNYDRIVSRFDTIREHDRKTDTQPATARRHWPATIGLPY